jgi:anaerobic magnesium-protoporphyrin IX monomethyl ester cyclase
MLNVLLFNPRATNYNPRIPNSILQVASSIDNLHNYFIVDGNLESSPLDKILTFFSKQTIDIFGLTVMPGPQLKQAIPISKAIKQQFPNTTIVWGGYFPSNQPKIVLDSEYVDVIINGMGDKVFPELLNCIEHKKPFTDLSNIIYKKNNEIIVAKKDAIYDLDVLPRLPYSKLNTYYSLQKYLAKTYLGSKTIAYHSSFGCPFTCSFCAVVPIYNARWKGKLALNVYDDIKYIKENFGGNAIEFHDNNFFVSEKRTVEFAKLIAKENMIWWGEARIDTMDKYSDESLKTISESGCKMIFFGAETGNDTVLKKMDKGGTQTGAQILNFAKRIAKFNIIPEYSFVLGMPADTEEEVNTQIDEDIEFIRKVKEANPATEIIIYTYSPVPTEGSELFDNVKKSGFKFPEKLDDWISPAWEKFDLRKNPLTPWLKPYMIDKIRNFETVLNGYYPSVSDIRFSNTQKKIVKTLSAIRYKNKIYTFPKEIKLIQKIWKYRQPETEGF